MSLYSFQIPTGGNLALYFFFLLGILQVKILLSFGNNTGSTTLFWRVCLIYRRYLSLYASTSYFPCCFLCIFIDSFLCDLLYKGCCICFPGKKCYGTAFTAPSLNADQMLIKKLVETLYNDSTRCLQGTWLFLVYCF